jgi:hypothetical protein
MFTYRLRSFLDYDCGRSAGVQLWMHVYSLDPAYTAVRSCILAGVQSGEHSRVGGRTGRMPAGSIDPSVIPSHRI